MTEETHDSSVETPAMTPEVEETPQTPEITLGETTAPVAEMAAPLVSSGPDAHGWFRGTGRRKSAVARVRIKPGTGEFRINRKKNLDEYFTEMRDQKNILPFLRRPEPMAAWMSTSTPTAAASPVKLVPSFSALAVP
jgi:small subunit ribosomal protein S9